jgi:hypothetical protein
MESVRESLILPSPAAKPGGHGLFAMALLTGAVLVAFLMSAHFVVLARWAATSLLLGGLLFLALRVAMDTSLGMAVVAARIAILALSLLYVGPYYLRTTGSDAEVYHEMGIAGARQLWAQNTLPEVDGSLGTREYVYLTAWAYLLIGPSIVKMRLLNTLAAAIGSWLFLRGLETRSGRTPRLFRAAFLLWPSVLYWTSIHGKDPWAYCFLGLDVYALANLITQPSLRWTIVYVSGLAGLFLIRPQIALLFLAAAALALGLVRRASARQIRLLRGIRLLSLAGMGAIALFILTAEAGMENLTGASLLAHLAKLLGGLSTGGTAIDFPIVTGWKDLLLYLPRGMTTVMFRPFPWEAGNLYQRLASLDQLGLSAAFLIIVWKLLPRRPGKGFAGREERRPVSDPLAIFLLAYCAGFVLLYALLSGNVGTLARERVQLIPFAACCAYALRRAPAAIPRRAIPRMAAAS